MIVGDNMRKIFNLFVFVLSLIVFAFNIVNISVEEVYVSKIEIDVPILKPEKDDKDEKQYVAVSNSEVYNNKYFKGFLTISNTTFKEPLYQYYDNDYYLTHSGNGKKKSSGATYLDYRINYESNKILVYGHNNDKLSLPFSILENYNDFDYYKEHKYLELYFDNVKYKYEIFSVYIETGNWDYMKINFQSRELWKKHLNDLKSRSIYDTGVSVDETDKIIILQTCSKNKEYSSYSKKYMLVIGKMVKE